MSRKQFENQLLDFVEGRLSPGGQAKFEELLNLDSSYRGILDDYQSQIETERLLAGGKHELGPHFEVWAMERIENVTFGFFAGFRTSRFFNWFQLGGLASCVTTVLVLLLYSHSDSIRRGRLPASRAGQVAAVEQAAPAAPTGKAEIMVAQGRIEEGTQLKESMFGSVQMDEAQVPMGALRKKDIPQVLDKFSSRQINPSVPVVTGDVSDKRGVSALSIPAGYRAAKISVDRRAGVEGFAKPDSRVDVLWTYQKDGHQQVATIVRSAKILSVGGMTALPEDGSGLDKQSQETVVLLTTDRDAKKIELAKNLGSVNLALVGNEDRINSEVELDSVTMNDLMAVAPGDADRIESAADGVLYSKDPRTGKQLRYVLQQGSRRWIQDRAFGQPGESTEPKKDGDPRAFAYLRRGEYPPAAAVHVEELLNYFSYDYGVKSDGPFEVGYEIAPSPLDSEKYLLAVSIRAHKVIGFPASLVKDVSLQAGFDADEVASSRVIGYESRRAGKSGVRFDWGGDSKSSGGVIVLYELSLTGSPGSPVHREQLGSFTIGFKDGHSEKKFLNFPLSRLAVKTSASGASDDFRFAAAVNYAAQIFGKRKEARGYSLPAVAALAEGAYGMDADGRRHAFAKLLKGMAARETK